MPADVISGEGGAINGEPCIALFQVARITEPAVAVCSATDGATLRGPGVSDWKGVYTGYGHTPSILAGTKFQFVGGTRGGKGAQSDANGAIMARTEINWDIEGAKFIEYTNYFECCTGAINFGAAVAIDSTIPDPGPSRDCTINLTGCEELRKMQFVLESKNPAVVTATTSGRRERDAGIKDGGFTCSIYTKDANFPAESVIEEIEFGVGDTLKWTMKWAIVTLVRPLLPIAGMFQADLAGKFTGFYGGAKGTVTSPAGAAWWP